jgi:hypothetical protein
MHVFYHLQLLSTQNAVFYPKRIVPLTTVVCTQNAVLVSVPSCDFFVQKNSTPRFLDLAKPHYAKVFPDIDKVSILTTTHI